MSSIVSALVSMYQGEGVCTGNMACHSISVVFGGTAFVDLHCTVLRWLVRGVHMMSDPISRRSSCSIIWVNIQGVCMMLMSLP